MMEKIISKLIPITLFALSASLLRALYISQVYAANGVDASTINSPQDESAADAMDNAARDAVFCKTVVFVEQDFNMG